MEEAQEKIGFKTEFLGFNKEDVLACIDTLTEEKQRIQEEQQAREESLRQRIQELEADRDDILDKTRVVCSRYTSTAQSRDQAQGEAEKLAENIQAMEQELAACKMRLFEQEQELAQMRGRKSLSGAKAETITKAAAMSVATDVAALRQQLDEVDRKIASATAELTQATEGMHRTIDSAGQRLAKLARYEVTHRVVREDTAAKPAEKPKTTTRKSATKVAAAAKESPAVTEPVVACLAQPENKEKPRPVRRKPTARSSKSAADSAKLQQDAETAAQELLQKLNGMLGQ